MRKVSITILVIFVLLLGCFSNVKAADGQSATFNLTTENVNVKVGDEVTITLSIGTFIGIKDITAINMEKEYDSTIFEYLGTTGQNGWEVKGDSTKILLRNENRVSSGTIAVLKFKALKEVGNSRIQISKIDASSDEDNFVIWEDDNVNSPYVDFKVVSNGNTGDDPTKPTDPTDPSNPTDPSKPTDPTKPTNPTDPSGDQSNNNKPNGSNTGINNDKTTANSNKIPQTGEPYMVITLIGIAVLAVVILFAKYKIYENKMK